MMSGKHFTKHKHTHTQLSHPISLIISACIEKEQPTCNNKQKMSQNHQHKIKILVIAINQPHGTQ